MRRGLLGLIISAILIGLTGGAAVAQDKPADNMALVRETNKRAKAT